MTDSKFKPGDDVHAGIGAKGGAGVKGTVDMVVPHPHTGTRMVHIKSHSKHYSGITRKMEHKYYKAPEHLVSHIKRNPKVEEGTQIDEWGGLIKGAISVIKGIGRASTAAGGGTAIGTAIRRGSDFTRKTLDKLTKDQEQKKKPNEFKTGGGFGTTADGKYHEFKTEAEGGYASGREAVKKMLDANKAKNKAVDKLPEKIKTYSHFKKDGTRIKVTIPENEQIDEISDKLLHRAQSKASDLRVKAEIKGDKKEADKRVTQSYKFFKKRGHSAILDKRPTDEQRHSVYKPDVHNFAPGEIEARKKMWAKKDVKEGYAGGAQISHSHGNPARDLTRDIKPSSSHRETRTSGLTARPAAYQQKARDLTKNSNPHTRHKPLTAGRIREGEDMTKDKDLRQIVEMGDYPMAAPIHSNKEGDKMHDFQHHAREFHNHMSQSNHHQKMSVHHEEEHYHHGGGKEAWDAHEAGKGKMPDSHPLAEAHHHQSRAHECFAKHHAGELNRKHGVSFSHIHNCHWKHKDNHEHFALALKDKESPRVFKSRAVRKSYGK